MVSKEQILNVHGHPTRWALAGSRESDDPALCIMFIAHNGFRWYLSAISSRRHYNRYSSVPETEWVETLICFVIPRQHKRRSGDELALFLSKVRYMTTISVDFNADTFIEQMHLKNAFLFVRDTSTITA